MYWSSSISRISHFNLAKKQIGTIWSKPLEGVPSWQMLQSEAIGPYVLWLNLELLATLTPVSSVLPSYAWPSLGTMLLMSWISYLATMGTDSWRPNRLSSHDIWLLASLHLKRRWIPFTGCFEIKPIVWLLVSRIPHRMNPNIWKVCNEGKYKKLMFETSADLGSMIL